MKLIFIYFLVILSCSLRGNEKLTKFDSDNAIGSNNFSIVIKVGQSYIYDLSKNIYCVQIGFHWDTISFNLSEKEKFQVDSLYNVLNITRMNKIDAVTGNVLIDDSCLIFPKFYTILQVKTKNSIQEIQIDETCDKYQTSNESSDARDVKCFLKFVREILFSKSQIKKAPKSDVTYL